jgi:hypothetical protein
MRMDRDSTREEVQRLQEQWRAFKDNTSSTYESYNKQLTQQEAMMDDKIRCYQRENEKLKETTDTQT